MFSDFFKRFTSRRKIFYSGPSLSRNRKFQLIYDNLFTVNDIESLRQTGKRISITNLFQNSNTRRIIDIDKTVGVLGSEDNIGRSPRIDILDRKRNDSTLLATAECKSKRTGQRLFQRNIIGRHHDRRHTGQECISVGLSVFFISQLRQIRRTRIII